MFTHGETVTRLRAKRVDDPYSGQSDGLDWADPERAEITGCAVYPAGSGIEDVTTVGRDQSRDALTVLAPPGADIETLDRLEIRGHTYQVQGFPHDYRHPMTGWQPGMAVTAIRREG